MLTLKEALCSSTPQILFPTSLCGALTLTFEALPLLSSSPPPASHTHPHHHALIHSPTHSLTHHSFTHPPTHPLTHSPLTHTDRKTLNATKRTLRAALSEAASALRKTLNATKRSFPAAVGCRARLGASALQKTLNATKRSLPAAPWDAARASGRAVDVPREQLRATRIENRCS